MANYVLVVIGVCLLIIIAASSTAFFLITEGVNKSAKKKENNDAVNIEVLKLLLSENSAEKIDTALDQFIQAAGDNYTLFKLSQNPNHYINEEMQKEMILYIKASVMKNMTKEMRTLIGLIHVINEEKDLEDLINIRVKLYVLNYMVQYNRPLDKDTDILL